MSLELDAKDRKILSELDMDARQPLSTLAKKVGLSREVVNYRIRQLEKKGVIQGYYTVLDTSKLGLIYCRMLFKYRKMTPEKEKELVEFCKVHKNISWLVFGEGKWDIVLVVLAESLTVIETVYDELNSRFGLYFQNPYVSIAFRVYEFKHSYLYQKPDYKELIVGGSSTKSEIDTKDYEIIRMLADNATHSLVAIANKLRITPKVVSYRIKKLTEEKVILGFRAKINNQLLGYDHYKVFLTMQSFNTENKSRVIEFLRYHPNVIYITKPLGAHTLEFEAMVRNTYELHEIMRQFKQQFGELLLDYETYFTYEIRSVGYLPRQDKPGREGNSSAKA